MAQEVFKALLNAAVFPFASRFAHQSVLIPALDQNVKTPQAFYGEVSSADFGVPQLIYAENVMPAGEGLIATSFKPIIAPPPPDDHTFDQFIQLRDANENIVFYVPARGKNFLYRNAAEGWTTPSEFATLTDAPVSRAYVNGRTLICYAGLGIYEYDSATHTLGKQTLIGITDAEVQGIGQSSNYLLAHTKIATHWSSLIDPLDFTPSLQTGAGNAIPQDVKGPITALVGVPGGFLIFTPRNCVAATYSTNVRQPFIFREVDNCGGVANHEQVATETSSAKAFAWTTAGLQAVSLRAAEPLYPDVSDFLAGKLWEEWDRFTKQFVRVRQEFDFRVKVAHISSRYLVISYGRQNQMFDFALILDTVMKRWGKVKVRHTDAAFFTYLPAGVTLTYQDAGDEDETYSDYDGVTYADTFRRASLESTLKDSVAFLQADGTMLQLVMDYRARSASAVVVLGRYQLRRSSNCTLQTVQLDHVDPSWTVAVTAMCTNDGAETARTVAGQQILQTDSTRTFGFELATGKNIAVVLEGTFELKDVTLAMTRLGRNG
jgi:hypothetical protein